MSGLECRLPRTDRRVWLLVALAFSLVLGLVFATPGLAQHEGDVGAAPSPPPGNGRLTVQVLHRANPAEVVGLSLALYALAPDGTPGLARGETGPDGSYTFAGISTDPEIVYLIGARYREIPFGERITFAAGETDARIEIEVAAPTEQAEGVRVEELRARVDWMGDRVVVRELLRLSNPGDQVVLLPDVVGGAAIVVRPLDPQVTDFSAGPTAIGEGLTLEDGAVRFRGPLYPGEQRVEYVYSLPLDRDARRLELPIELRESAGRVVVVAGTDGVEISGAELLPSSEVLSDGGQRLSSWARGGLDAGERYTVELGLPETRNDPGLVRISRSDVWLELDDTRLTASVDLQLEIAPGAPVSGTPDAPLFHVSLPKDASLNGVSPEAERLGLVPKPTGGFDVIGPIGPEATSLGYSYRIATRPEGVDLDMRFPLEVATLNVLIADTGLALESSRLHRRRPFRQGTRNYLHREAFNIVPSETVDLTLAPLRGAGIPRTASIALSLVAAAGAAFFLSAPLRRASSQDPERPSEATPIEAEREALYETIADLDHDFETGKLEPADYEQMRTALRGQAIELLRSEREAAASPASAAGAGAEAAANMESTGGAAPASSAAPAVETATGAFCPSCSTLR